MQYIKYFVATLFLFYVSIELNAQSSFDKLIESLPSYRLPVDIEKIDKRDTISTERHNKIFLNYPRKPKKIRPFFYGIDDAIKSDGNVGRLSESFDYLDQHDKEVTYYNKVFPMALLVLSDKYFSVILRKEVFDFISIDLYNFDSEGILLSAIKLFEYSKWPLSESGKIQHAIIESNINQDGTIHQRTEADFIIDRKFILDPDGHFRVIEEEIKDFPHK